MTRTERASMDTTPTPTSTPTSTPTPAKPAVHRLLTDADERTAALVARLRGNAAVDRLAYGISQAANHSTLWHTINLCDLLLGVGTRDPQRRSRALRRSVIQGVEGAIVNGPVKLLVRRRRPTAGVVHPHQLRVPVTSSFPSGHATAGACAAELLAIDIGHRRVWWTLAILVGWSRVHVGVHHPSDVLAGWVIGASTARAAGRVWPAPGSTPGSEAPEVI